MIKNVSLNLIPFSRLVIAIFFAILFSTNLLAQDVWTTDQFLDFRQNQSGLPFQDNLDFINNKAKGMPFVDRYEFRTESDEMDLEQQQYQFRFKFNSNDERKAYNKILLANKEKYVLLQSQYELDILKDRYDNILDLYFNQREMDLIRQDLELLLDKKIVLKKIIDNESQINVNDWLAVEDEIFNVLSDSLELEMQKKEIAQKIFVSDRNLPRLDESDFIQIKTIERIVRALISKPSQHPDEALAQTEENLANAEFKFEEAQANKWLEFAQIQYKTEDKLSFQKEFSIGTSITIPNSNNNRIKKNDAALELLERRYKTTLEREENKKESLFEEAKLLALIQQLDAFLKMKDNQKLDSIFDSLSEKKVVSPLILLDLKRTILKNRNKQLRFEKDIYESYLNLLSKKAVFLEVPRSNYLSEMGK